SEIEHIDAVRTQQIGDTGLRIQRQLHGRVSEWKVTVTYTERGRVKHVEIGLAGGKDVGQRNVKCIYLDLCGNPIRNSQGGRIRNIKAHDATARCRVDGIVVCRYIENL